MCQSINIPQSTLSTWLSPNNLTLPSLDKLDYFCDNMGICTTDLFIPNSSFEAVITKHNNTMLQIKKALMELFMERGLTSIQSRVMFLFQPSDSNYYSCEALYYSYTRDKTDRCIPIQQLDEFAMRFEMDTYKLIQKGEHL